MESKTTEERKALLTELGFYKAPYADKFVGIDIASNDELRAMCYRKSFGIANILNMPQEVQK
jgi:hypothetical protein